jgi:hypothetical protein
MGDLKGMTKQVRLKQYADMVRECKQSGMTVQSWCDANGISVKNYYYRQRKVRTALLELNNYSPLALNTKPETKFAKLPSPKMDVSNGNPLAVINIEGIKVEVYGGADEATITASLKAIREIC